MDIYPSRWSCANKGHLIQVVPNGHLPIQVNIKQRNTMCRSIGGLPGGVLLEYLVQEKQAEQTIRARLPGCAHHPVHHREGDKGIEIEWLWWWWAGVVNVDDDHPNFESVPASLPRTVPKKDNSTLAEGTAHIQETNFISWEVKGGCFPVYFYRISFKVFPYWKLFFCTHTYWPSLFS